MRHKNFAKITMTYIKNQPEEDYATDQISIKEYADSFTGSKNTQAKKRQLQCEQLSFFPF